MVFLTFRTGPYNLAYTGSSWFNNHHLTIAVFAQQPWIHLTAMATDANNDHKKSKIKSGQMGALTYDRNNLQQEIYSQLWS